MNTVQRTVLAIAICLGILVLFLHNPMADYDIKDGYLFHPVGPCSEEQKAENRQWLLRVPGAKYTEKELNDIDARCYNSDNRKYKPFQYWYSEGAHLDWLSYVVNMIYTLLTIAAMAGAVWYIFKDKPAPVEAKDTVPQRPV